MVVDSWNMGMHENTTIEILGTVLMSVDKKLPVTFVQIIFQTSNIDYRPFVQYELVMVYIAPVCVYKTF